MNSVAKGVLVVLGVLLLISMSCLGLVRVRGEIRRHEFEQTAHGLGFEPTFSGVTEYIRQSIEPGMTRSEVERILSNIVPLEVERGELNEGSKAGWGPIACDHIWLDLSAVLTGGPVPVIACYDEMGGLVGMDFAEPDMSPLGISAPLRE